MNLSHSQILIDEESGGDIFHFRIKKESKNGIIIKATEAPIKTE